MNKIEEILINNLEKDIPISLSTIGGLDGLQESRKEILTSKFLDIVLNIIVDEVELTDREKISFITDFFSDGLKSNLDEITVREAVVTLCNNPEKLSGCFNTLLDLLKDRGRNSFLKSQYLLAAFQIATYNKAKKHYLIGYLLEEDELDDQNYFSHYVKILGLSYSFFQDESIFERLTDVMNTSVDDDGLYEVGMGYLGKGISAISHEDAYYSFNKAQSYFKKVDSSTNTDAYCIDLILEILLSYANKSVKAEQIHDSLNKIENTIRLSSGWHRVDSSLPWASARNVEIINWYQLVSVLKISIAALEEISWFDPKIVIENYLLQIYNCNRTLLKKEAGEGVDHLIQPLIQMKFNQQETYVYLLDKWISSQPQHELWSDARKLRQDIADYKRSPYVGKDVGTAEIATSTVPFIERVPNERRSHFIDFAREYMSSDFNNTSYNLKKIFEKIIAELEIIDSFRDQAIGLNFKMHVYNTLKFLESRMDATKGNISAVAYLFEKDQKENALQNDYYQYMGAAPSNGNIKIEVNNIGGGRADVVFNHIDHQFVFEVKRELSNSSFKNIRKQYLGQASEYQNTGPKLGGLLVLDLTNNKGGIGAIEDNVKLEFINDKAGKPIRAVLVIKVVGNRTTPSHIKLIES